MTRLIIARHGNTFKKDEIPTRVGARTDLPLVDSGKEQAKRLGLYMKSHNIIPDKAFVSNLQRTQQTAHIAFETINHKATVETLDMLDEIDYGPDENQPEENVIKRIGEKAIEDWDQKAIVPDGWDVDPDTIVQNWIDFAKKIEGSNQSILVVTSNGIARFAPHITGAFETFAKDNTIKLSTGALALLNYNGIHWQIDGWNIKP